MSAYPDLQPDAVYCIHGVAPYVRCFKCVEERRVRDSAAQQAEINRALLDVLVEIRNLLRGDGQ